MCSFCVFNRQTVRLFPQHSVFALASHVDYGYGTLHMRVCVMYMWCLCAGGWPLHTDSGLKLSAPAGGQEQHQEGKLCAAGGPKSAQASRELPVPGHLTVYLPQTGLTVLLQLIVWCPLCHHLHLLYLNRPFPPVHKTAMGRLLYAWQAVCSFPVSIMLVI